MSHETMSVNAKAAINAYNKSPTESNRERLSDAMFALEATLMFPDNDFVYITALRLLMSHNQRVKPKRWSFMARKN